MRPPVTLETHYRFFAPLIVWTVLSMGVHSLIHAALARMDDPKQVLAAFSAAMSFHSAVGGPIWSTSYLALSVIRDRRTLRTLLDFLLRIGVVLAGVYLAVAFTPLGAWLFGTVLGASPEVVRQARWATLILGIEEPLLVVRATAMALVMQGRNTRGIPLTTLARVLSLLALLWLLPLWVGGAIVGAWAFILSMLVETALMLRLAGPALRALPEGDEPPPRHRELWRFGWPLMASQTAEFGVPLAINFFLGRVQRADLALAAFGVMYGLVRLLLGALRNLTHSAQTLVHTREERRVLLRFTGQVVGAFTLLLVGLFYTPAQGWVLRTVMGLTDELADYVSPALLFTVGIGVTWGYASLLRGLVTNTRRTSPIALGSVTRVAVVLLAGLLALPYLEGNGAVFAILALTASFAAEALLLGGVLLRART